MFYIVEIFENGVKEMRERKKFPFRAGDSK